MHLYTDDGGYMLDDHGHMLDELDCMLEINGHYVHMAVHAPPSG